MTFPLYIHVSNYGVLHWIVTGGCVVLCKVMITQLVFDCWLVVSIPVAEKQTYVGK